MGLNFCFLQKNVNWFKRYSFLKCTCWFILLLVKNKLISTCSSIFVEWQLFARNRAVSVPTWKEPGYSRPPLVSFSVCSWFMDSLDTVEGFNHFYIYIWLLESWRFLSNCGCCNISLYKWDHKLGIFLPFPENKITIAIPRIAKRSYVSVVSSFGIIKQNYRHHYPLQSIFFYLYTSTDLYRCAIDPSRHFGIFFRMLIFFLWLK